MWIGDVDQPVERALGDLALERQDELDLLGAQGLDSPAGAGLVHQPAQPLAPVAADPAPERLGLHLHRRAVGAGPALLRELA